MQKGSKTRPPDYISNQRSFQEMKFIIDTFSDVIGACSVTHNVLVGLPVLT